MCFANNGAFTLLSPEDRIGQVYIQMYVWTVFLLPIILSANNEPLQALHLLSLQCVKEKGQQLYSVLQCCLW